MAGLRAQKANGLATELLAAGLHVCRGSRSACRRLGPAAGPAALASGLALRCPAAGRELTLELAHGLREEDLHDVVEIGVRVDLGVAGIRRLRIFFSKKSFWVRRRLHVVARFLRGCVAVLGREGLPSPVELLGTRRWVPGVDLRGGGGGCRPAPDRGALRVQGLEGVREEDELVPVPDVAQHVLAARLGELNRPEELPGPNYLRVQGYAEGFKGPLLLLEAVHAVEDGLVLASAEVLEGVDLRADAVNGLLVKRLQVVDEVVQALLAVVPVEAVPLDLLLGVAVEVLEHSEGLFVLRKELLHEAAPDLQRVDPFLVSSGIFGRFHCVLRRWGNGAASPLHRMSASAAPGSAPAARAPVGLWSVRARGVLVQVVEEAVSLLGVVALRTGPVIGF